MSKVYKMPVLMAFYNHGNVRMEVSEVELLASWKKILLYRNKLEGFGERDYI